MHEYMGKTGGGGNYFEPLRFELDDCFGALKNIQPDSVFSSRRGMIVQNNSSDDEDEESNNEKSGEENLASASVSETGGPKKNEKRKCNKSKYFYFSYNHKQL